MKAQTTTLLAFVDDAIDAGLVADLQRAAEVAADDRPWSVAPPRFVDSTVHEIRTVGCVLELFATRDDDGEELPSYLDRMALADTKALIDLLAPISARHHIDIGLELSGESVGWIVSGEPDRMIRDGLIGPWEAHVEESR